MTFTQHINRELAAVSPAMRAVLVLLWVVGSGVGIYFAVTTVLPPGVAVLGIAILVSVVPVLFGVSLLLKAGYEALRERFPRLFEIVEGTVALAILGFFALAMVYGVLFDTRLHNLAATAGLLAFGALAAVYGLFSSALEELTSTRGLLLIIAVLLWQILSRLNSTPK
jgi:hypothetical protein